MTRFLSRTALCGLAAMAFAVSAPAATRTTSLQGRIKNHECGDNCYLTIVDASGKEHTGLCTARECAPWNRDARMPARYKGRRVVVTVGRGKQVDGSGNVMGQMTSFDRIGFLD